MSDIISVNNFSYRYQDARHNALRHVSFTVPQGSFFCIVGANGSGKSTLCHALTGLIPHYFVGKIAGSVEVAGQCVSELSVAQLSSTIGLVFQNPFNQLSYTSSTVAEELAYGLGNHAVSRDEMIARVLKVAKLMRIDHILDRNPLELSGGQVQRVAFGSAFIMEPKILVLDECTTQLDPLGSEEIFTIVKELNCQGVTVIMVDHDMERVARVADTILVLHHGQVATIGSPYDVFTDPNIEQYDIEPPDYVRLGEAIRRENMPVERMPLTHEEAVNMLTGIFSKQGER